MSAAESSSYDNCAYQFSEIEKGSVVMFQLKMILSVFFHKKIKLDALTSLFEAKKLILSKMVVENIFFYIEGESIVSVKIAIGDYYSLKIISQFGLSKHSQEIESQLNERYFFICSSYDCFVRFQPAVISIG